MNYWGPKVRGICRKCGENVQCSIGLDSEGVFVVVRTKCVLYNETPLYCVLLAIVSGHWICDYNIGGRPIMING